MAEEQRGRGSLMDNNVPSQLDEADLEAELEIEIPDSQSPLVSLSEIEGEPTIEIILEEDGGATVDFDPTDDRGTSDDFYANLAEEIPDRDLGAISSNLLEQFEANKAGRHDWEDAYANGLELLGFNYEEREQPFRGSSGVTHPLLAEAATQFQAQAFNELLPSRGPVKTEVMGEETLEKKDQARRVQQFMNYYITSVMEDYTPDMDQMLFYLPLAGSTFKKIYYDEAMGRCVSRFVPAENLVVPYETSDLDTCENITQVVRMSLNDLKKKQLAGQYRDIEVLPAQGSIDEVRKELDYVDGVEPSNYDYDCTVLEVHANLDLEGYEDVDEDGEPTGIKIPYIVTISEDNGQILSIRRNYAENDELKKKIQYFVHYKFLPGFGFYGLGLIHTIGGLSRTATSALRQLIDAGTLSNLPAGFKARGLRIRDDDDPLQPGEFRDVDAPGGAIRDSLMPLPFKGPDGTLFNLLGFVVEAGQRFATITDLKVGDGNQSAAVGTTIAMMEQGSRVMSAVHKRLHYAMKKEFKILARVMHESLPQEYPYSVTGGEQNVMREDFDDRIDVIPVSNPNVFSQAQRIMLAQTKLQLAGSAPDLHNMPELFRDMYEALGVTDVDRIMKSPPQGDPEPTDPIQENIDAIEMVEMQVFEGQNHEAHITTHLTFSVGPMVSSSPPIAVALQKHIMEHVKVQAQEMAAQQFLQQVGSTGQTATEEEMLQMQALVAQFEAQGMQKLKEMSAQITGEGQPDPLITLKEQELQQRARKEDADTQVDMQKLGLDQQNQQMRSDQFQQRLASQERQTDARIDAAMQRELLKLQDDN